MMAVPAAAMETNTSVRPSLHGRKSLSSRRLLSRYESMPSNDDIKTLKTSNSERLLQLKNRLSLGNSYQKIDSTSESVNKSWDTEKSSSSHLSGSGLRRRRSFNDKVHAMYKKAGVVIRNGVEDPVLGTSSASSSRSSEKSSHDLLSRATNVAGRKQRAAKRHSDPTGDLSASRTTGTNRRRSRRHIVADHSNHGLNDEEKRRDMFQNDFPGEPIPSDAILMRLYGNMPLPPPQPSATRHPNAFDEQASISNESYESAPTSPSTSRSSKNLLKTPLVSPAFSESSKIKASPSSSRKSLSKSKLLETSDRSRSHSQTQHSRGRKSRRSSKSRDLTSDPKGSKSKRKESRKSAETIKIRKKNSPKHSPSEGSRNSDFEAFQALLDLSNGSFFDDDELNNSESMNFMRTSLKSINSAPYGEETGDKDRKKKRKGKRDEKIRSRSADQNRDTSTKSRKGKRSSKSKASTDHDRKSLHSTWYDGSGNLLMDSSLRGEQPERAGKTNQSPKVVARKKSSREDSFRLRKNSKSAGSPGNLSTRKNIKKGDNSPKTNGVTAKEIIETARDVLASPKLTGNEQSGKSRWNAQRSPVQNASLPRTEDTSVARDSHCDGSVSSSPEPTTPQSSQKQIDFHLEFLEYQNVSPLTVASKKISTDAIAAIGFLES